MFIPKEWVYQLLFKKCESEAKPDIALALWQGERRDDYYDLKRSKLTVHLSVHYIDALKNRVNITDMDVINRLMGAFTKPIDLKVIKQIIGLLSH